MEKKIELSENDLIIFIQTILKEENLGYGILYHGGENLEGKEIVLPLFLTPNKNIAEKYSYERGGWINEFYLDGDHPLDDFNSWVGVLEDMGVEWENFNEDTVLKLNKKDYGGGILDIIYNERFRESAKNLGYDVIILEDSGNQETTGLVYLPLYKEHIHFLKSYQV